MSRKEVEYNQLDRIYRFNCPHCDIAIEVQENEVNCQIFRCGRMKNGGAPVNPHAPKEHCDRLFKQGLVWGCCKPFKFFKANPCYVEPCEYI